MTLVIREVEVKYFRRELTPSNFKKKQPIFISLDELISF